MYTGNVKKVMADAKKIARRLRETDCTQTQLRSEYHCSHEAIMKAVRSQISEEEWLQIRLERLRRGNIKSRFQKGFTPWNKGKSYNPGGRSIKTRFTEGHLPHNAKTLGTITVRINKRDKRGPYRMIAVQGPTPKCHKWIPYAQYVWEKKNGPLPKGLLVVHIDGNSMNDSPENLEVVNRKGNIELMKENNPGWKLKAIRSYKKTVRVRRMKMMQARRGAERQRKLIELEAEQKKMAEQQMLEIYGPQICVWECTNCSAEYKQETRPERCTKCGRFSFEKNLYRRKTG